LALAAIAGAALAIARLLTPAPGGMGTHHQLGLPPCTFRVLTGHGCPGCGLTTAFAQMARGELPLAWQANPMGVLLYAITAISIPVFFFGFWRPQKLGAVLHSTQVLGFLILLLVGMVGTWAVRLALGMV
jgi:hypothetical protein